MTALSNLTTQKNESLTILQRIAEKDKTAVQGCIDNYGNLIWALARKFTNSTGEAEAATRKIFTDIWRYAERGGKTETAENILITRIALRHLNKLSDTRQTKSM